ncbi:MAG TPA: 4'-phosphopantetheinyl transferase superfamily protein [Actinocrinis sp.]|jgi:4'-phosphopantetheinyl transferase EntD
MNSADRVTVRSALVGGIVPPQIATCEVRGDIDAELLPAERPAVARAVPARQREFATGRACAREALARLGVQPGPIPPGRHGEPRWPRGIVGSITHCAGYRGAAVARDSSVLSIGIDAEPNTPVPQSVLASIADLRERNWIEHLRAAAPETCWDRLLFSAKESVYKAWYPLTRAWLDFTDAVIAVDPPRERFTARLRVPGPVVHGSPLTGFSGRWTVQDGLILTAVVVP